SGFGEIVRVQDLVEAGTAEIAALVLKAFVPHDVVADSLLGNADAELARRLGQGRTGDKAVKDLLGQPCGAGFLGRDLPADLPAIIGELTLIGPLIGFRGDLSAAHG